LLLDVLEPLRECVDGPAQGILRIDAEKPCVVDERKEQVTELFFTADLFPSLECLADLLQLLAHFLPDLVFILPVEAHPGGPLLNAQCPDEGRHAAGNPFQHRGPPFLHFQTFPVLLHLVGAAGPRRPEYMRMPAY